MSPLLIAGAVFLLLYAIGDAESTSPDETLTDKILAPLEMAQDVIMGKQLPPDVAALIEEIAPQYGVDVNLAKAQCWAESRGVQFSKVDANGNPITLKSSAGALGLFQLMPATAAGLGVDPNDARENVIGGCKFMGQLLRKYNDAGLALAAYNAGPGNVSKYGGIPPFKETQNYVTSILANVGVVV